MKILKAIYMRLCALAAVFANEWRLILSDKGVLTFFIALPLAYPVVYTLIYNPEVTEKLPVAVVDHSRTAESRRFAREINASPDMEVYDYVTSVEEGKELVAEQKVFGILEIPADYAQKIGRGERANVMFYANMNLLLRYRTYSFGLTDVQLNTISEITEEKTNMLGALADVAGAGGGLPVSNESYTVGDPEQGFASFVMPGIVVLILQQSMILGIAMITGTSRERRRRNGGMDPRMPAWAPAWSTVIGKTLAYTVFFIPATIFCLHYIPELFNLPHIGSPKEYLPFILPMLLSSSFFGLTLGWIVKDRESSFMVVVFTSVIFLFLSGLTWPTYAMPHFWQVVGDFVPSTWAVQGFIRINSNAATLAESSYDYYWLWGLTGAYFITAWATMRYIAGRRLKAKI